MDISYGYTTAPDTTEPRCGIEGDFKHYLGALLNTMQYIFEKSEEPSKSVSLIDDLIEETLSEHFKYLDTKITRLNNFLNYTETLKSKKFNFFSGDSGKTKVLDGSKVNELIDEPIKIPEIPVSEKEYIINKKHIEKVLSILEEKYKIQLSLEGKEMSDLLSLKLEDDLGLIPLDIKLFIPSMFMNSINSEKYDRITFVYQEDYIFIERISSGGSFKDLVQLYAMLDERAQSTNWFKTDKALTEPIDPSLDN